MSIYIMTHKDFEPFTDSIDYKTMLVGAKFNKASSSYIRDDSMEDNISEKNGSFCELTGAYWIWKHADEDIVGLVHYRRYFVDSEGNALSLSEVESYLEDYDVILPEKMNTTFAKIPCSNKRQFINILGKEGKESWDACEKVLLEKYPEYEKSFRKMEKSSSIYFYNMCIMKKENFDAYHEWLFDILFEVENRIDVTSYKKYNQRMYGFLSERLLNLWVIHHQLKAKELPLCYTEPISFTDSLKLMLERKRGK